MFMVRFVMKGPHFDTNSKTANLGILQEKNESIHLLSLISPSTFSHSKSLHLLPYKKSYLNNKNIGYPPLPYFTGRIYYIKASFFLSAHFFKAMYSQKNQFIQSFTWKHAATSFLIHTFG